MLTIITGLIGHLHTHFPAMFWLYEILKRKPNPLTPNEIAIAHRETVLYSNTVNAYLVYLEHETNTLINAFNKQILKSDVCYCNLFHMLISDCHSSG